MSGTKFFVDTNIALYWLNGDKTLADLLNENQIYLSFITELELLGYSKLTTVEKIAIQDFLSDCKIVDINAKIKTQVIELRQRSKLKLPDSIILASAMYLDIPLLSADSDFKIIDNINLIYYEK